MRFLRAPLFYLQVQILNILLICHSAVAKNTFVEFPTLKDDKIDRFICNYFDATGEKIKRDYNPEHQTTNEHDYTVSYHARTLHDYLVNSADWHHVDGGKLPKSDSEVQYPNDDDANYLYDFSFPACANHGGHNIDVQADIPNSMVAPSDGHKGVRHKLFAAGRRQQGGNILICGVYVSVSFPQNMFANAHPERPAACEFYDWI